MLILTPSQQKIFDYLRTHKKPVSAQYLSNYFMISYETALKALRFLVEEEEAKVIKVGQKKLYAIAG
jgi:Fe2+ or Zn2+ uptake regulation protein